MLFRILSAAAIGVLPIGAFAGPNVDFPCPRIPGDPANCTPLVACIPEAGIYFTGRAFGWDNGSLAGSTNAGFACTGNWTVDGPLGTGKAVLECDNDLNGVVFFTYQDAETGTTTGFGGMSNGLSIRVWSGHNIQQFVINEQGDVNANLICGVTEIPIS